MSSTTTTENCEPSNLLKTLPLDRLMNGPLVAWVQTFREDEDDQSSFDYSELVNGAFLDRVLSRIDPKKNNKAQLQPADGVYNRILNLNVLIRKVKAFFENALGQLILARLPDPVKLGRNPDCETSVAEMNLLLLLVLGCAVQGPNKEDVIEDIKKLPVTTQHSIVQCIQQVADNPVCVWNNEWAQMFTTESFLSASAEDEQQRLELCKILIEHLRRIVQERDEYAHQVTVLVLKELSSNTTSFSNQPNRSPFSPESGVVVELAETKAKVRRFRQELEEKCEQFSEMRDEFDALTIQLAKLKHENMELVQEARLSKALRDELDIVRERASKVDRLEAELNRYKDKLNDIDYYKARLDELREDNRLLEETKGIIESQLESARHRAELVLDLEGELLSCKSQISNLLVEKETEKERLKKLAEENAHLQLCTKNCLSESASLTAELESLKAHYANGNKDQFSNLGEQMSSMDLLNKARRLEMENQRLAVLLSSNSTKESGLRSDSNERIFQLESECSQLKAQLSEVKEELKIKEIRVVEIMDTMTLRTAEMEKQNIEKTSIVEVLKAERCKVEELELQVAAKNDSLQRSADILKKREESFKNDLKELEAENCKLHKTIESLRNSLRRLGEIEKENTELESENHRLDRESKGLLKETTRLKQGIEMKDKALDEYSSKVATLDRESKRLLKELEFLQAQGIKVRELERENKDLQQTNIVEHQTLTAIREELVLEKIRCQQLQCQLETQTRTLEHSVVEYNSLKSTNEELVKRCSSSLKAEMKLCEDKNSIKNIGDQDVLPPTLELSREVLAVKDRLVELERQNAVLLAEKDNLRAQLFAQKERLNESGSQLSLLNQQLATLQVENYTLKSQLSSLTIQNSTLQTTLTRKESEWEKLHSQIQSSDSKLERLTIDQQELQKLHEQLQSEYDVLVSERELLKTSQRENKSELRALQDQIAMSNQAEQDWQRLRTDLQEELEKSKAETRSLTNLRAEHSRLKDDFRSLFVANEKLKSEYKNVQSDYKTLRGDHHSLKIKHTQQQGEVAECRHQITNQDVELGKIKNKCAVLEQWNTTIEEDKRNLVNQVSQLLSQYHELLSQTLEQKDSFHEETKNFSDKLNHLKRQKEILEDKIMEQFRRMENFSSSSSNDGLSLKKNVKNTIGAIFGKKGRRASSELVSRVPRSVAKSIDELRRNDTDLITEDASSLESGPQSESISGCGSQDGSSADEGLNISPSLGIRLGGSVNDIHSEPKSLLSSFKAIDQTVDTSITNYSSNALYNICPVERPKNSLSISSDASISPIEQPKKQTVVGNNKKDKDSMHISSAINENILNPLDNTDLLFSDSFETIEPSSTVQSIVKESIHSLALERAGSRQPLCVPEAELAQPTLVLSNGADSIQSFSSPYSLPNSRGISPSDNDLVFPISNNNTNRLGVSPQSQVHIPRDINAIPSNHLFTPTTHSSNSDMFPHLTTTTRINVNISTAAVTPLTSSSPSSPLVNLERRGEIHSIPRISGRILVPDSSPPLLPARTYNLEGPSLPPRPNFSNSNAKTLSENGNGVDGSVVADATNSIWYEYGCV